MDSKLALAQKQSSGTSDTGAATASNKSSSSTASSTSSIASSTEDSSLDTKQQNDNSGSGDEVKTKEDMWVETRVIRDANAVLDVMKPRSAASRVLGINISKHISADLEHRLNATSKYAVSDACITQSAIDELVPYSNNRQQPLFDTAAYAKKKEERSGTTASAFAVFQEWISPRPMQQQPIGSPSAPLESMHGEDTDDAKQIHTSVQSFVYFVCQLIDCFISALDPCTFASHLCAYRHVLPCVIQDYEPSNDGDSPTIGAGITIEYRNSDIKLINNLYYDDAIAIIEARQSKIPRIVDKAYAQLMRSTHSFYNSEFGRRFVFGLTVCDSEVRVCLFSNDAVFSSSALDMSTTGGRLQFIELLVNWSLCDEDQLGYDTTIHKDEDNNCWVIKCPDTAADSSGNCRPKIYYFDTVLPSDIDLFGRHTDCFLVTDEKPTGDKIKPKFILKDAWPEATEDHTRDRRDEVQFMRRITEELANSDVEDLFYLKLDAGGRVVIDTDMGRFEDNTKSMLGPLYSLYMPDSTAIPFRAHKRLVISPIGEPLGTAESVHEVIVVLSDVMRCHTEVLRRCNILHHSISESNILIVRDEGKPPRGLLIDFGCAVDVSERQPPNPVNVGMFLYRSINNLQGLDVERTELDDWESLLYLLCLCATTGVGEACGQSLGNMEMLAIRSWCIGAAPMVGILKTLALASPPAFENLIVRHFNNRQPDIEYLRTLARDIYTSLFWNPSLGDIRCNGTAFAGGRWFNPFEERVKEKDTIVATLTYVLGMARQISSSSL